MYDSLAEVGKGFEMMSWLVDWGQNRDGSSLAILVNWRGMNREDEAKGKGREGKGKAKTQCSDGRIWGELFLVAIRWR